MTDREAIRKHVTACRRISAAVSRSAPELKLIKPEHVARAQLSLAENIIDFIDSLPPAADERLVQLARAVKRMWGKAHASARRFAQAPLDDPFASAHCQKQSTRAGVCAAVLRLISELNERGEQNAGDSSSDVQPQGD